MADAPSCHPAHATGPTRLLLGPLLKALSFGEHDHVFLIRFSNLPAPRQRPALACASFGARFSGLRLPVRSQCSQSDEQAHIWMQSGPQSLQLSLPTLAAAATAIATAAGRGRERRDGL